MAGRSEKEIPAHVIEPIIFSQLPAFLDPSEILKMSERDINTIADESDSRKAQRQKLQSKLDVLTSSSLLCKLYLEKDVPSDAQETPSLHTDIKFSCGKTPSSSIGTSGDNEQCQDVSVISDDSWEKNTTLETPHAGLEDSLAPPIEDGWRGSSFFKKEKKKGKKAVSRSEPTTEAWP